VLFYVCELSCIHVVLCPSWRQILATPLSSTFVHTHLPCLNDISPISLFRGERKRTAVYYMHSTERLLVIRLTLCVVISRLHWPICRLIIGLRPPIPLPHCSPAAAVAVANLIFPGFRDARLGRVNVQGGSKK